ncbi:larval cuticle protein 65Ag1-like isoform X3 [Nylanderia fulva]|uniref:larval cuticle protein 65Ag1-like isoform X3 n=1 Tax=Nylanderia fulva TaxID=613905 RepID=UPI0010FB5FBB|nr:larval cuticle protein 65Ag1-like isoform X3 [Nylanderia fulva]XP_029162571.1 larval cuticle protein 65Ag1-like isoform X3 [Nylanderia fulva]
MNLLIIIFCVLIKTMMILAADRLSAKSTTNIQQYVAFDPTPPPTTHRYTTSFSPTTRRYTTLRGPRSIKSLYNYNYNTDTGIQAQEEGHFNNVGSDQENLEAQGSYTDNKGNTFEVSYIANENGFQPEGAHLPTIPPLIKKAFQYIAEHPEKNTE